jgi:acetyl esterase/lipase
MVRLHQRANFSMKTAPLLNLAYGPDVRHKVDLFPAGGTAPGKLVLYIHGGGWVTGGKAAGPKLSRVLKPAGYAVAALTYRFAPATDMAGIMQDVAQAAAFLMQGAEGFGLAPDRFVVQGHSAGGHLAALLGTDQSYLANAGLDPRKLVGVQPMDGVFDVAADMKRFPGKIDENVFGPDPQDWTRYSPISHVDKMRAHPRFGVLHENVRRRFVLQAKWFTAALRASGEAFDLDVVPGLSHVEMMRQFEDPAHPMISFTLAFLAKAFAGKA